MSGAHDLLTRWPSLDIAARQTRLQNSLRLFPGELQNAMTAAGPAVDRALAALWRRDASLWSSDPRIQPKIVDRLGWLDSPAVLADALDRLQTFASAVRRDGFAHVVLLGMGGSSLAPHVLHEVVGSAAGWPRFHMLDSTDPAAVRRAATRPERTLYILASKSGSTIEPNSLAAHFGERLQEAGIRPGAHFVAITDEGTELSGRARREGFREVFINPSDIGGRYSAISFFGLVPAALMGHDLHTLVGWSLAMLSAAQSGPSGSEGNPAAGLAVAMGCAALAGRDKLTLLLPPALEAFGLWVEQLIAESTGKQGKGIVPVAGEAPRQPGEYGPDRVFVRIAVPGAGQDEHDRLIRELKESGAPVVDLQVPEPAALGAEFVRWEIATAIAGAMLEINPFDEPNVQQAKDATRTLLRQYESSGRLPVRTPDRTLPDGTALLASAAVREQLAGRDVESLLSLVRPGDYVALLAYLGPDEMLARALHNLRDDVGGRTGAATMFGYGPRYLHSTGQLHKGGPNTGVFLLLTSETEQDVAIPGQAFSFATLELAQALGDFESLDAAGRRVLHVHLPRQRPELVASVSRILIDRIGSG